MTRRDEQGLQQETAKQGKGAGETRRCLESRNFCDKASRPSNRALGGTFPRRRQGRGLLDRRDERAVLRAPCNEEEQRCSKYLRGRAMYIYIYIYVHVPPSRPYHAVVPRDSLREWPRF